LAVSDRFECSHKELRIAHVDDSHRSLNAPFFVQTIASYRPDTIVVMGTCLVGKQIIAAAPLVLNLHTGLSPYYRGGYTNLFPFIEDDYGYFGVTVHKMSPGIDSGDIVASARPDILPDDTYSSINARCIISGTSLMVKAVRYAERKPLPAVRQWEMGKVFHARHFNNYVAYKYLKKRIEFVRQYIELQSQGRLPALQIVSLPNV
jgi:methionyl-tRNA formyltransferase